jgi:hypothetical protein
MNPTKTDKQYWNQLATIVGCIACRIDGNFNDHVSIHHCDGRSSPGCHSKVLPLCASHHQSGSGNNPLAIAIHPYKARFESKYCTQEELMFMCKEIIANCYEYKINSN